MSWGELTCKWSFRADKPCTPTMEGCNKDCDMYINKDKFINLLVELLQEIAEENRENLGRSLEDEGYDYDEIVKEGIEFITSKCRP